MIRITNEAIIVEGEQNKKITIRNRFRHNVKTFCTKIVAYNIIMYNIIIIIIIIIIIY
jgi:hypothetical protein